nr:PREDICTED: mitochondrial fission 1 protein isoform X1 [Bos mutus]
MEAVLNELVSVEDLLKFERKFKSEKAAGSVSKSTQFEYAWCLVRSKYNDDIRKGLALLEELLPKGSKEEQRDYVFYLAVGNYRLKEYEKALKYVRGLLQTEPQNNQAKELERLIDKAMKKGEGRPLFPSASLHSLPSCFLGPQHPRVPLHSVNFSSVPRAWAFWSLFRWCPPGSSSSNPLLSPALRGPHTRTPGRQARLLPRSSRL